MIDVRDLPAPEPMQRVMPALEALVGGEYIHVIQRFEPHCLLLLLKNTGYEAIYRTPEYGRWDVWIWRATDALAELAARRAADE